MVTNAAITVITIRPSRTPETMSLRVRGFTGPSLWPSTAPLATVACMDIRLYAIGMDEVVTMYGAAAEGAPEATQLREIGERGCRPEAEEAPRGLGRFFARRTRTLTEVDPDEPDADDVEAFLTGDSIAPHRVRAAWRLQERLIAGRAWGSFSLPYGTQDVDQVDFALARGGVSAAVGLRHLFASTTPISLVSRHDLVVGWHDHDRAHQMAESFRTALDEVPTEQRDQVVQLVDWLDQLDTWAEQAAAAGRPRPDLIGFWYLPR